MEWLRDGSSGVPPGLAEINYTLDPQMILNLEVTQTPLKTKKQYKANQEQAERQAEHSKMKSKMGHLLTGKQIFDERRKTLTHSWCWIGNWICFGNETQQKQNAVLFGVVYADISLQWCNQGEVTVAAAIGANLWGAEQKQMGTTTAAWSQWWCTMCIAAVPGTRLHCYASVSLLGTGRWQSFSMRHVWDPNAISVSLSIRIL